MNTLKKIIAFLKKDFLIYKSYRLSLLLNCLTIIATIVTFYFIARIFGEGTSRYLQSYGGEYFPFVLIGLAFSDFLFMGLSTFSQAIRSEQMTGTLGAILITPTKISNILIGASIYDFMFSGARVFLYLLIGVVIFGVSINLSGIFVSFVILGLTVLSFSGLGILAGSFIMIFKKGDPITWAMTGVSALLGGVYYPVDVLPNSLQRASEFLPITYALRASRMALLGEAALIDLVPDILILAMFSLIILPVSMAAFRFSVGRARMAGTLLQY
jgi:ABC-2 type transport system permease protein